MLFVRSPAATRSERGTAQPKCLKVPVLTGERYARGPRHPGKEPTMRKRLHFLAAALLFALLAVTARRASAAPEAHILRVDPRASQAEGAPVLTTVVELVQNKRLSEAIAECASLRGDAQ